MKTTTFSVLLSAVLAAWAVSAPAQSLVDVADATFDAIREERAHNAAPDNIRELYALAKKAADEDHVVVFCGFFPGMSADDARMLAAHNGLAPGEWAAETAIHGYGVWRLAFSLRAVRTLTKGGNSFDELAQAVANRIGSLSGKHDYGTGEEWYEYRTIDGIEVRLDEKKGLVITYEDGKYKPPKERPSVLEARAAEQRKAREEAAARARELAERRAREAREEEARKAREEAERGAREAREAAERKAFDEACESGETMAVLMRDSQIRTALKLVGSTNTLPSDLTFRAREAFAAASNRLTHVEVGPSAFTTEVADSKGRTMPLRDGYFFGKNDNVRFLRVKENVAKLPDLTSVFPKGRQLRVVVFSGGATDVSHARFDAFPDLREIRIPSDSPLRDEDFGNLPAGCRIVRIPPEEAKRSILPKPKPLTPEEQAARKAEEREAERRMAYYHWSPLLAGRNPGKKGSQYAKYGAAGGAAAAMIRALRWLAVRQNADGSWGKDGNPALTSTVALTFLAQGESLEPLDGRSVDSYEFGSSLSRAVAFLTDAAAREAEAPVHEASALMAFALAEATDHTPSEKVRGAALAALRALLRDQGADGAWRTGGRADDALTGWCIQALAVAKATGRGGDLPGLDAAIDRAKVWTKTRSDSPEGVAVRAFCARLLGVDGVPSAAQTLDPLDVRLPQLDAKWADGGNTGSVPRPLLVWYYDTYARFFEGGGAFPSWNRRLLQGLMTNQRIVKGDECGYKDTRGTFRDIGSWKSPSSAEWNPGRPEDADLAATCLCALQLAVYYRYDPAALR